MYFIEKPEWLNLSHPSFNSKNSLNPKNLKLIISLDSKTERRSFKSNIDKKGTDYDYKSNNVDVVSYQFSAFYIPKQRYYEGVIYTDENYNRLSLNEIIVAIFKKMGFGLVISRSINNILIIAHNSIEEYSTLKDRKELNNNLCKIRKSLCSFDYFPLKLKWDEKSIINSNVVWRDTILLSPVEDDEDLNELSAMITIFNKKEELPEEYYFYDQAGWINFKYKLLKEENKELYEKYVLAYPRITLEFFLKFVSDYWKETNLVHFPITIGEFTVQSFFEHTKKRSIERFEKKNNINFKSLKKSELFEVENYYKFKLLGDEAEWTFSRRKGEKAKPKPVKKPNFHRATTEHYAISNYTGSYNIGLERDEIKREEGFLIVDLDLTNAFLTGASTLPIIDWESDLLSNEQIIFDYIDSLQDSHKKFAVVGFFLVDFEFTEKYFQYCIPIRTEAGLSYPPKGKSAMITFPELCLARKMGCNLKIKSGMIFPELNEDGEVVMAFNDYLSDVVKSRKQAIKDFGKDSLEEKTKKRLATDFYGKLCKSLKQKKSQYLDGKKGRVPYSQIALPQHATMITGIIRAAIIELVNVFKGLGYRPLSITTDGFAVAIPREDLNIEIEVDEKGIVKDSTLKKVLEILFDKVFSKIKNSYPIKLLEIGRENLGLDKNSWIEVKHLGDEAKIYRTRANYINYQDVTQSISRGNAPKVSVKNSEEMKKYEGDGKFVINASFPNIFEMNEKKWDYVRIVDENGNYPLKKFNTGLDWKRKFNPDDNTSIPYDDMEEYEEYRKACVSLHKSHLEATPERVLMKVAGKEIRLVGKGGDTWLTVAKLFISAVLQENWWENKLTYEKLKDFLNAIFEELKIDTSVNVFALKNWKRGKIYWNNLPDNPKYKNLWNRIAEELKISDPEEKYLRFIANS